MDVLTYQTYLKYYQLRYVIDITILMRYFTLFFHTKSSKSDVYFMVIAHFNQPHFQCRIATWS